MDKDLLLNVGKTLSQKNQNRPTYVQCFWANPSAIQGLAKSSFAEINEKHTSKEEPRDRIL